MTTKQASEVISSLDLDQIKVKLMHKASGEGWSQSRADAVETEYRRFLHLVKVHPQEQAMPFDDVDLFWHYHILDTLKYAADCELAFGHFLHHDPYVGLGGGDPAAAATAQRTAQLYEAEFGEAYGHRDAAFCTTGAKPAFCTTGAKPAFCTTGTQAAFCTTGAAFCTTTVEPAFCTTTAGVQPSPAHAPNPAKLVMIGA